MSLEVFNPFAGLLGDNTRQDSWRWGTVVSGSPVRVRLDGDSEPSLATPDCLVSVTVGDRVRVQISNRRMTVFGKLHASTRSDPGEIVINGTAYATSGSVPCPAFSWSGQTSTTTANAVFYGTIAAPVPYSPPAGFTFQWAVGLTTRLTFVGNAERVPVGETQNIRVIQIASAATDGLTRLNWQLVKI